MRTRVFKLTTDDWYPAFKLAGFHRGTEGPSLVEVSLLPLSSGDWRVCVWGADDFGMERDYADESAAIRMFNHLIQMDKIKIKDLDENGFSHA